jgi:hypothetical protein
VSLDCNYPKDDGVHVNYLFLDRGKLPLPVFERLGAINAMLMELENKNIHHILLQQI